MIAMFIKLFAIKTVASIFFGCFSNEAIMAIDGDSSSRPLSILDFVNENRATSAPDIRAEQIRSIRSIIILVINEVLVFTILKIKTVGSGSKIK